MDTHTVPARTLIDARTTSIRITTLPPDVLPAPIREATSVPSARARLAEARPVRLLPAPAARRRPRGAVRVAVTLAVLVVVAAGGAVAGHARLGLSALAPLAHVVVTVAVLVALAGLAASAARVHCPGCRGMRR
jgi:hypothetical protein